MTRKIIFLFAVTLILAVPTIFSQEKTSNFLGIWKLTDADFKAQYGLGDVTMTVSEADGKLVIARSGQKTKYVLGTPYTESYSVSGKTDISLTDSPYSVGVRYRRLRVLKENKLQFLTTYKGVETEHLARATWIISEDGKTLTVKNSGSYSSNTLVFTKQ